MPARQLARTARLARIAVLVSVVPCVALAIVAAGCRRVHEPAAGAGRRPPVWVIGLDGADWRYLDRAMASGAMPELARLVREGRRGVLTTEQPPLSPILWTTMMTGVSPLEHRILDFARLRPADGVPEPITSSERRAPALWNMASGAGRSSVVLGLWATHPAEPIRGLVVADRFFSFLHSDQAPAGSVSPPDRLAWARERLERAQSAADPVALRAYLPEERVSGEPTSPVSTTNAGDPYADPVVALRRILVETATYDALFRDSIAEVDPELAILYLQGTDSIGHAFARFVAPALRGVDPSEVARFGGVPDAYFRHVDELLGGYRRLAGDHGARLLIVSDHGFRWGDDRPQGLSSTAHGSAAKWHREHGIWLLWGRGVRAGSGSPGGIRQVCATVLDLLGLPAGAGLAGPSLASGGIDRAPSLRRAPVDYRRGFHPMTDGALESDTRSGDEALAALRALGYAAGEANPSRANAKTAPAPASTRTAASFDNEGLILRAAGRDAEARVAYESALRIAPGAASASFNLSELLRDVPAERERSDELLFQALAGGLPEPADALAARALRAAAAREGERSQRLVDAGLERLPNDPRLWLLAGRLRLERRECSPALAAFEHAVALAPERAEAYAAVGVARLCLGDADGAATAFRRSLALDPNQPQLQRQLAELGG